MKLALKTALWWPSVLIKIKRIHTWDVNGCKSKFKHCFCFEKKENRVHVSKVCCLQKFTLATLQHKYQENARIRNVYPRWTAHHYVWMWGTQEITLEISIAIGWHFDRFDLHTDDITKCTRKNHKKLWPGRWSMRASHHLSCSLPDMGPNHPQCRTNPYYIHFWWLNRP